MPSTLALMLWWQGCHNHAPKAVCRGHPLPLAREQVDAMGPAHSPMGSQHTVHSGSQTRLWSGIGRTEQLFPAAGGVRIRVLESIDGRGTGFPEVWGPAGWICPLQTHSPPCHLSGALHPHAGPGSGGRLKALLPGLMGFCNDVFHGAGRKPRE